MRLEGFAAFGADAQKASILEKANVSLQRTAEGYIVYMYPLEKIGARNPSRPNRGPGRGPERGPGKGPGTSSGRGFIKGRGRHE
jgi:hypothetical protein